MHLEEALKASPYHAAKQNVDGWQIDVYLGPSAPFTVGIQRGVQVLRQARRNTVEEVHAYFQFYGYPADEQAWQPVNSAVQGA